MGSSGRLHFGAADSVQCDRCSTSPLRQVIIAIFDHAESTFLLSFTMKLSSTDLKVWEINKNSSLAVKGTVALISRNKTDECEVALQELTVYPLDSLQRIALCSPPQYHHVWPQESGFNQQLNRGNGACLKNGLMVKCLYGFTGIDSLLIGQNIFWVTMKILPIKLFNNSNDISGHLLTVGPYTLDIQKVLRTRRKYQCLRY